jgi:hypothetical protein
MTMRRVAAFIALIVGTVIGFTDLHGQQPRQQSEPGRPVLSQELLDSAQNGPVLAIVRLRSDSLPPADGVPLFQLQQAVGDLMAPVIERHGLADNPQLGRLTASPVFRAMLSGDQLAALAADPDVAAIVPDRIYRPSLLQSVPMIGAPVAWGGGLTGTGWTVVVIDTGVESAHAFLANKIMEEACYSTTIAGQSQTLCPDGSQASVAQGSGTACPATLEGCDHGTHVAGIAVGTSTTMKGVAPDARLFPIQVFSRFTQAATCGGTPPCIAAYQFNWEQALDRVFVRRQFYRVIEPGGVEPWDAATRLGGVNMSLGSAQLYSATCDDDFIGLGVITNLRENNNKIPTIAAAGNEGSTGSIAAPACLSMVLSVGSTLDTALAISSFSNRASFLSLMAPGSNINSSVPGGQFANFNGTSMATPHVTGAMTLLRQHAPYTSVTNILNTLRKTADQIIEGSNTFRAIRIDRALQVPFASDILSTTLVQTPEDTPLNVPLTLSDFDTPENNLIVTVTSANTALVPNDSAHIEVLGSAGDRTIRLTPLPDVFGQTQITVNVSDGVHTAETTPFTMTVAGANDLPTIVPSSTNVAVAVGAPGTITVTVNDIDSAGSALALTATSLNQTLLPNGNIAINQVSTGANSRTFQMTMVPAAAAEGSSTVTLRATDGAPGGLATTTTIVFSAGTPAGTPTISTIADQTTNEGTPLTVNFTLTDSDTPLSSLVVTATSSNPAVVAASGLVPGGTDGDRTLRITPVNNASGVTTITVRVTDNSFIVQTTFRLTVSSVNGAPVITGPASSTTTPGTAVTLAMTVTDADSPGAGLTLTGTSANQALLPDTAITITPTTTTANNRGFNVRLAPTAGTTGQTIVTLTATDDAAASSTFNVTLVVATSNNPPTISYIPNQTTTPNTPVGPIAFTVSDAETPAASLTVSAQSSNQGLLPNANLVLGGSGGARTITLTPAGGQLGSALVTVSVSDGLQSATMSFALDVVGSAPDAPTSIAAIATGNTVALSWTRALGGAAPTSYVVEIGTSPGATTLPTQNTGTPDTSIVLTLPDGTYYFRVRAVNTAGISAASPETSTVVGSALLIPGPPSNFTVSTVGLGAVFAWSPPTVGAAVSAYIIEAGSGPGLSNLAVASTGSASTSFHVPSVPVGTYYVRVRGSNGVGTGAPSQDVSFTMGPVTCSAAPGVPVLLTPVVAGGAVTLSWTAPGSGSPASSYVLMAGSASGQSNLAAFDTLSSATSFAAAVPFGTYFVRVAARNPCGDSAPSNEVSFTAAAVAPGAPGALTATVGMSRTVALNWVAPTTGGAPTGYVIEAGSAPGLTDLAVVPTGSTLAGFSTVAPPGIYYVRVRAVNGGGTGPASNEVTVIVP